MGLLYDGNDFNLTSRARVTFTLSGETDSGLAFGASFRADNAGGAAAGTAGSVFISGDFGKLSMGDVDSAAMAATGDLFAVGLTGLGDRHEMQYVGRLMNGIDGTAKTLIGAASAPLVYGYETGLKTRPRALYTYSIDGLSVYASLGFSKSNTLKATGIGLTATGADLGLPAGTYALGTGLSLSLPISTSVVEAAVGASYEFDGFMVAAAYEQARFKVSGPLAELLGIDGSGTLGHATLAAQYSMDGITVKAVYGRAMNDLADVVVNRNQYGLSMSAKFDATTVTAFGRRDFSEVNHYGIGASYDLGGGASIKGGVAKSQGSSTVADFGLAFTF